MKYFRITLVVAFVLAVAGCSSARSIPTQGLGNVSATNTVRAVHGTAQANITEYAVPAPYFVAGNIVQERDGAVAFNGGAGSEVAIRFANGSFTGIPGPSPGPSGGYVACCFGMAVDWRGVLWIGAQGYGNQSATPFTALVRATKSASQGQSLNDFLGSIVDVALDGHGNVLSLDAGGSLGGNVSKSAESGFPAAAPQRLSFPTQGFPNATALAFGPKGHAWAAVWTDQPEPDGFTDRIFEIADQPALSIVHSFGIPSGAQPAGLVAGPDGELWFTEPQRNKIGRMTTSGAIKEYSIPTANSGADRIAVGPDGALWFTESAADQVGRITVGGAITEYALPTPNAKPEGIASRPVGCDTRGVWIVEFSANKLAKILPT